MLVALIQTGSVNLTQWLPHIPCRGNYAQSKQRRLSRWLHNPRLNPHRLYAPLIRGALSDWQEPVMYLSLDTSVFWNQYCLVRLAVVYRGRTLPLVWRVLQYPVGLTLIGSAVIAISVLDGIGFVPPRFRGGGSFVVFVSFLIATVIRLWLRDDSIRHAPMVPASLLPSYSTRLNFC
jgi:hypothetical protein